MLQLKTLCSPITDLILALHCTYGKELSLLSSKGSIHISRTLRLYELTVHCHIKKHPSICQFHFPGYRKLFHTIVWKKGIMLPFLVDI